MRVNDAIRIAIRVADCPVDSACRGYSAPRFKAGQHHRSRRGRSSRSSISDLRNSSAGSSRMADDTLTLENGFLD